MLMLLDLDGTLINDRAYRVAIDATIARYCQDRNLTAFPPSDDEVHVLHAHGYSNEWDTVAFLAGILQLVNLTQVPDRPNYQEWTRRTAALPGLPNERARDVLLRASPPELHGTIHALLDRVTDVGGTPTTRIFAELVLGSELFTQHYGLAPEQHSSSLLAMLDEPLINARSRAIILSHQSCIFTARPSLPPRDGLGVVVHGNGYELVHPPEAEIGLRLLQLDHLPMVALGHVQWLADQRGERVYDLTKPGPVQALAAMLAASNVSEPAALRAAYRLWKLHQLGPEFEELRGQQVYVLEDNAAGVRACHSSSSLLREHGIDVTVHGIGIATAQAKRMALLPVCDRLYDDVNTALADIAA